MIVSAQSTNLTRNRDFLWATMAVLAEPVQFIAAVAATLRQGTDTRPRTQWLGRLRRADGEFTAHVAHLATRIVRAPQVEGWEAVVNPIKLLLEVLPQPEQPRPE